MKHKYFFIALQKSAKDLRKTILLLFISAYRIVKWHKMPTFGHTKQPNEKYENPL